MWSRPLIRLGWVGGFRVVAKSRVAGRCLRKFTEVTAAALLVSRRGRCPGCLPG